MAFKKETETNRKKRAGDGAVSARYTKHKKEDEQAEKKPAVRRKAAVQETKKPVEKPAAKRRPAVKTDELTDKPAAKRAAKPDAKTTAKSIARKANLKAISKVNQEEEKPAKTVRRAVMASDREAQRAKEKKAREPGRIRREKRRIEAAMRDRRRAVSRKAGASVVLIALLTALFVSGALLLPSEAVFKDGNSWYVQLQSGEACEVALGVTTDSQVQILSGLSEGDMVVY